MTPVGQLGQRKFSLFLFFLLPGFREEGNWRDEGVGSATAREAAHGRLFGTGNSPDGSDTRTFLIFPSFVSPSHFFLNPLPSPGLTARPCATQPVNQKKGKKGKGKKSCRGGSARPPAWNPTSPRSRTTQPATGTSVPFRHGRCQTSQWECAGQSSPLPRAIPAILLEPSRGFPVWGCGRRQSG